MWVVLFVLFLLLLFNVGLPVTLFISYSFYISFICEGIITVGELDGIGWEGNKCACRLGRLPAMGDDGIPICIWICCDVDTTITRTHSV